MTRFLAVLAVLACVTACADVEGDGSESADSARGKGKIADMPEPEPEPYDPEPEPEPAADAGAPVVQGDAGAAGDAGDAGTANTLPAPDAGAQVAPESDAGAAKPKPVTFFDGRAIVLTVNGQVYHFTFRVEPDLNGARLERENVDAKKTLPTLGAWMIAPDVWTAQGGYDRFDVYFDTATKRVLTVVYETLYTNAHGQQFPDKGQTSARFLDRQ